MVQAARVTEGNMSKLLGLFVAAFAVAAVAFWAAMLTDPPKTEAQTRSAFDVSETLKTAAKDAPTQDAGVIACTYVLRDGHRCD
jgi:hypothetical protein